MHPPASGCTIRLLGVPEVWIHGHQAAIHRRLVRALLYYVAAHPDGVSRDILASLLSPDEPQRTARRRLTRLLWHLRNALGPEAGAGIHADADRLWLNATWRVDVHAFTAALEPIRAWRKPAEAGRDILEAVAKGVALYRGEFLSGFALPRHSEFENWVLLERERLEQLYVEALVFLAQAYAVQGDYPRAIAFARQGIEVEPIREDLHRLLMQMYERTGQRAAALSQYERCVIILEKELGVDPLPETRDLYQAILRGAPLPSLAPRAPSHVWDALPGMDVPFVGRERILERLIREWDKTLLGMGRMVFLRGEPGIGKTRLVHEFVRRVDAPILVGAGEPGLEASPYHPLQTMLAKTFPTIAWETLDVSSDVLAEVSRLLPDVRSYCPETPLPLPTDAAIGQSRMFEALFRFLLALLHRPTAMFVDDAQWTTEALWQWFTFLSHHITQTPLLLIFAFRPEEAPPALQRFIVDMQHRGLASVMDLSGLSEKEVATLVGYVCEKVQDQLTGVSAHLLSRHTGGNPYFILETVRWLLEQPSPTPALPIPNRVRDVLHYRLELLSPLSRQVLYAAAVLSPYLTVTLLARTAGRSEEETVEALEDLMHRQLLVETGEFQPAFRFAHEQLRQVVYEEIGIARRRHLHRRAAHALQTLRPALIQNLDAALANHWEAAGELARALEATLAALERAAQQFAFLQVIHLADRALALTAYLPKTSPVLTARASALLWRGRAHRALRRYQEAQMDLEQAICLGETLALTQTVVEALAEKIHIAIDRWQSAEAEALAERCVLAAQQGRDMHLWARSIYLKEMVAVHFRRAVDEASLSKALEVFEKNADNVSMAEVWNLRGVYAMLQRDYEGALAALDKALALGAQAHHYFLMHRIQANRGHVLYNRGDFAAAWEAFTRAEEWLHNVGVDRPDNIFEVGRGYVAIHLGRTEEGEEALKRARSLARSMGSVLGQVYVGLHLALLRGLQGRFEEAISYLSPFLSQEARIYPATYIRLLETWGWLLREQGKCREALRIHKAGVKRARRNQFAKREASSLCEVGHDLLCLGRIHAARRLFQKSLDMTVSRGEKAAVANALIGLAKASPGDRELAERALETARATGSLLLLAEATQAAVTTYRILGDRHTAERLRQEVRPRLQAAGWQGMLAKL